MCIIFSSLWMERTYLRSPCSFLCNANNYRTQSTSYGKTGVHVVNDLGNKYVTGQRPISMLLHKKHAVGNICQMWVCVCHFCPLGIVSIQGVVHFLVCSLLYSTCCSTTKRMNNIPSIYGGTSDVLLISGDCVNNFLFDGEPIIRMRNRKIILL